MLTRPQSSLLRKERSETTGDESGGDVWKVTRNSKIWTSLNSYVYARPLIHCLYLVYANKIYVRAHVKITEQWKFTLRQHLVQLTSHERCNKSVGFGPVYTYQFLFDNGDVSISLNYRRIFRFQTKPETYGRDLCHLRWQRGTKAIASSAMLLLFIRVTRICHNAELMVADLAYFIFFYNTW